MPTRYRKRQHRSKAQPHPKILSFDRYSASSPGSLPHDLIKHCLTFVHHDELFPLRRVSHAWLAAVADCVECLLYAAEGKWLQCKDEFVTGLWTPSKRKQSRLVLCSLNYMTEAFREQITEIWLTFPNVHRFADGHLHGCKALQRLNVFDPQGCETVRINGLEQIPALREVRIGTAGGVDATCLSQCKALQKLEISGCYFTKNGLQGVEKIPALEWLNLEGSHFSHEVGFLARCRSLKVLSLTRCGNLKDADIAGLELIPTLEELDLSQTNLTDVTVLSQCNKLKKLCLTSCCQLTDAGIQGLERIPTLEELLLVWVFGITSVSHLSASRSLKGLMLGGCSKLSDPGIQGLELIPTLEVLDLSGTGITSVSQLAACKALKRVKLHGCKKLTDTGIERIAHLVSKGFTSY